MNPVSGLHGNLALLILGGLLLAEETGVPLPLVPGDFLLVAAGLLIATGSLSAWVVLPVAMAASGAGAFFGYTWAAALGEPGLRALASRLHAGHHLDRVSRRLKHTGARGILVSRLIPGMRVNTTLLAGALGVERRTFLLGALPAVVLWVVSFTALGAVAGIPVEHFLARIDRLAVRGALLAAVGLGGYLFARLVPGRHHESVSGLRSGWWLAIALAIDLGAAASLVAGLDILVRLAFNVGGIDDWEDVVTDLVITLLVYIALMRGATGITAGEALLDVRYRPHSASEL